jgi:thiosulfate/3-mercaptopyruvate sulfurtransferase
MSAYANPNSLVTTAWVEEHVGDPKVLVVEVDVDTNAYEEGHVPGALAWNWTTQLCDRHLRDVLPRAQLEELLRASGVTPETTIVLYGDNNNWFAAWALWQLEMYGHADVRLMNGGRTKWLAEGRALSLETPERSRSSYAVRAIDEKQRIVLDRLRPLVEKSAVHLVDVRSPGEFSGEILSPPGLPETCQRGGHIPGARSVPWATACNPDGTFKSREDLEALYGGKGVKDDKPIVAYCRIGERSSHTWFVLRHLLGRKDVMNYDGSWTEWGNLVRAPIETGAEK